MRLTHVVCVLVLVVAALAGVPAAQAQQEVVVQTTGDRIGPQPSELPATYLWHVELRAQASGGACACTEATATLHLPDLPENVTAKVLPSHHRFNFLPPDGAGTTANAVLVLELPEHYEGTEPFRITVDGTAGTDTGIPEVRVLATQVTVEPPAQEGQDPGRDYAWEPGDGGSGGDDGTPGRWSAGLATAAAGLGLAAAYTRRN